MIIRMHHADETHIIEQCKANSRMAQKKVYDHYAPIFFPICRRYTKDIHDAEQVLQDSFLKIFNNIASYEGKGSFEGWMKRILINTCLDFLRSSQHKADEITFYPEELTDPIDQVSLNQAIIDLDIAPILNIIQLLPNMSRLVFNLFVFEGFSHKEIALQLKISEGTSQWHVNNARNFIKIKLHSLNIHIHSNNGKTRIG